MRFQPRKPIGVRLAALVVSASLVASCGPARIGTVRVLPGHPPGQAAPHHPQHARLASLTPKERAALEAWFRALALAAYFAAIWRYEQTEAALCGGDLPPCYVMERESHGNPWAVNPGHQGAPYGDPGDPATHASGKWQFMPGTWNNYDGYPWAAAAPASVQNAKAREVWAGGAGASHWACC